MKLIKEIIYEERTTDNRIQDVDAYIESRRYDDDFFDLYFELGEDDLHVYFANIAAYERSLKEKEAGEERAVQVESAVLVKKENIVYWLGDNNGLETYNLLAPFPYWTRDELQSAGVSSFRESGRGQFSYECAWGYKI